MRWKKTKRVLFEVMGVILLLIGGIVLIFGTLAILITVPRLTGYDQLLVKYNAVTGFICVVLGYVCSRLACKLKQAENKKQ